MEASASWMILVSHYSALNSTLGPNCNQVISSYFLLLQIGRCSNGNDKAPIRACMIVNTHGLSIVTP